MKFTILKTEGGQLENIYGIKYAVALLVKICEIVKTHKYNI